MRSYRSELVFFFNIDFMIIFNFFAMSLLQSHNVSHEFCMPFLNISFLILISK